MKYYIYLAFCLCSVFVDSSYKLRVGNPDDTEKIERPCPTYDLNCIRVFFQKHAQCKKTFGPAPDPLTRPQANFFVPRTNISITMVEQKVGGINGRIEEVYINRDTDNMVIAVEFRNLSQTSDKTHYIFHRRAKEPVVTIARPIDTVTYDSIIITAIIPKIDDLQLKDAECTTFSNDNTSRFFFMGPEVAMSSDPQVQLALAEFLTDLPTNIQELFLPDSFFYIATFIQYNICDFGLLLT